MAAKTNIGIAFFLNLSFAVVAFVGALLTNSVAVMSDALHDFGDAIGLGLSWYMEKVAQRKRTAVFSFGYKRFSLLASILMGLFLLVGSVIVLIEAIPRFLNPEPVHATGMILIAILGIAVNGAAALRINWGKTQHEHVIALHLLEDILSSGAILIAGIFAYFGIAPILDTLLSVLISIFVIWNALGRLRKSAMIFLQSTPDSLELAAIERGIRSHNEVADVHDTHVWSLDGEHHVLTSHLVVKHHLTPSDAINLKNRVRNWLIDHDISHSTLEIEYLGDECPLKDCVD